MAKPLSDIGLVGLAVMGQNLALNIADHGFQISVFNRTTEKTDKFVADILAPSDAELQRAFSHLPPANGFIIDRAPRS
jgi:6-phosphogluconate dehydrogenase